MIAKLSVSNGKDGWLWYLTDDKGIHCTYLFSASMIRNADAAGIHIVFLIFSLMIGWRLKP